MKNKAFTLIELLAVIVILGLLATIATPNIMSALTISKENSYHRQIKLIEEAAERWAVDNPQELTERMQNSTLSIDIEELQTNGYLEKNLNNPATKKKMEGCISIEKRSKNIYTYKYTIILSLEYKLTKKIPSELKMLYL